MATYIKKDFASPNGPILLLSAKGSTTASIAQANGVKDFSGNGNHGRAYGGVTVVKDAEMGDCFHFNNNSTSRVVISSIGDTSTHKGYTVSLAIRHGKDTGSSWFICRRSETDNSILDWQLIFYQNIFRWFIWDNQGISLIEDGLPYPAPIIGEKHIYGLSVDYENKTAQCYYDGEPYGDPLKLIDYPSIANTQVVVGGPWNSSLSNFACLCDIGDVRIYPRALSAAEVKYLYNGFQPNIIVGQTIPSGAILDLSARGLTTAGIAQANGVVDRSGNGNHGQAYNGVAVVNDDEMGSCFSFDGTAVKKITFSNTYPISTNAITLAVKMRHLGRGGGSDGYNAIFGNNMVLCYSPAGSICLQLKNNNGVGVYRIDTANNATLVDGNIHFLIGIMYIENNVCYFQTYVDGVLQSPARTSGSSSQSSLFNGLGSILIGELTTSSSYKSNIQLSDIRIYPRALTALEVQQLADASLKKITNIKSGSSDVRQIFSNGEMIYAKTNDYSLNL